MVEESQSGTLSGLAWFELTTPQTLEIPTCQKLDGREQMRGRGMHYGRRGLGDLQKMREYARASYVNQGTRVI